LIFSESSYSAWNIDVYEELEEPNYNMNYPWMNGKVYKVAFVKELRTVIWKHGDKNSDDMR